VTFVTLIAYSELTPDPLPELLWQAGSLEKRGEKSPLLFQREGVGG